jgi:CheY-like chemotaxis protein
LSSFTTGLEFISEIIQSNENTIKGLIEDSLAGKQQLTTTSTSSTALTTGTSTPSKTLIEGFKENNQNIRHCLRNIRDTNTFMVMTINRCIDYTKASRGFRLVPKYETVDLLETLRLPLECMKNIQERIQIELKTSPEQMKEMCSHIITDKQWLQENILCLLSNAVKYSTGGIVTIGMKLVQVDKTNLTNINNNNQNNNNLPMKMKPQASVSSHSSQHSNHNQHVTPQKSRHRESFSLMLRRQMSRMTRRSVMTTATSNYSSERIPMPQHHFVNSNSNNNSAMNSVHRQAGQQQQELSTGGSTIVSDNQTHCDFIAKAVAKLTTEVKENDEKNKQVPPPQSPPVEKKPEVASNHNSNFVQSPTSPSQSIQHLRFEIEDNGIGMSNEGMAQLFNPFKQAQRLAGGTGLGLYSLAKRIEALNGTYGVAKRTDGEQGSLFWFTIPYRPDFATANLLATMEDELVPQNRRFHQYPSKQSTVNTTVTTGSNEEKTQNLDDSPVQASPTAGPMTTSLKRRQLSVEFPLNNSPGGADGGCRFPSLTILLVDDSPSIVKMSTMMLKRQGHTIQSADNGEIALRKVQEQWQKNHKGFDLILMDLQMPVMDGLEATRRLRRLEANKIEWIKAIKNNEDTVVDFELQSNNSSQSVIQTPTQNNNNPHETSFCTFQQWNHLFSDQPYHHAVIGMSANSDDETAKDAIEAGADAFLPKPFPMDLFSTTVIKVLKKINENYQKNEEEKQKKLKQQAEEEKDHRELFNNNHHQSKMSTPVRGAGVSSPYISPFGTRRYSVSDSPNK